MLNPKIGDTMLRVMPPHNGLEGHSQAGKVVALTDDTIELVVQVDIHRHMIFRRSDGMDNSGLGTFIVRPDFSA